MKKFRLLTGLLALLGTSQLFALRSGDQAQELADVRFLTGRSMQLPAAVPETEKNTCKVVVFMLTHAADSRETLNMVQQLAHRCRDIASFAVVTPDPRQDAELLLKQQPDPAFAFGVDTQRKTTAKFMAGSLLFPMAFVIDSRNRILWNGEAVDLPEIMERFRKKQLDPEKEKKISSMLDELQLMMRERSGRRMRLLAEQIFSLDPANAAALRMRLFFLENTRRIPEAWQLIKARTAAAPEVERLYYTALDLLARYPELRGNLPEIIALFKKHIRRPEAFDAAVLTLLNRFEYDAAALSFAQDLYQSGSALPGRDSLHAQALHCDAGASLAGTLGIFGRAAELQRKSLRLWQAAKEKNAADAAEKRLKYYTECDKTAAKWQE